MTIKRENKWLALVVLAGALAMIVLDGTIVGVSLPSMIQDLNMDLASAQWVNSLYSVVLAALLMTAGRLGDRVGRRRLLAIGVAIFVVGSLCAALATDATTLIAARALQGVGGAAVLPATLSSVNSLFRGKERAAAFGVWGAVMSGAAALGPLLGGAFTTYLDWRWIFWVNLPLGLLVLVGIRRFVPETTTEHRENGTDIVGILLSALGFGLLVFVLIEGPSWGWLTPRTAVDLGPLMWGADAPVSLIPILGAIAVGALVAFIRWELRRARQLKSTLLDVSLFSHATFSWGNATATMVAMGEFGLLLVLPLYLINVLAADAMGAGLILAAMAAGAFLSGAMARHLAASMGADRVVVLGLGLEVAGVAALAWVIGAGAPLLPLVLLLVLYGLGLGLASAQLTSAVLRDIPPEASGQGSATQSTLRQLGSGLGTAIAGSVLAVVTTRAATTSLAALGLPGLDAAAWAQRLSDSAGGLIPQVLHGNAGAAFGEHAAQVAGVMGDAFTSGVQAAMVAAVVCLAIGWIGSLQVSRAARAVSIPDTAQSLTPEPDAERG
ncbi:DHA2 family efflux MFS transporter permease subunit [Paeniglutamicibacter kerguelensis]|uniref:EmrB/QacA subfamily drug resistance transporter n=1 Tax=Paeniglutamicibacter kerguelensis TaxID=254788 RepID=A0ABS4XM46_9MICC|nr:DHA2 family efflux MFS transporter permease subunit [Paeniglutamicibacter kerguelensis]MBP2388734.1 EmrB/QacA subfamily drug resistance transporter [Paeniglutamicibacter kerguelensis]